MFFLSPVIPPIGIDAAASECETVQIGNSLLSPDGKFRVKIVESLCGFLGSNLITTVYISKNKVKNGDEIELFVARGGSPEVAWIASGKLNITIVELEDITESRHIYDGVEVNYRLANKIQTSILAKNKSEEIETIKKDRAPYADRLILQTENKYNSFQSWIRKNVSP